MKRKEGNQAMAIRAVVFDIGGVLEITPATGWVENWEARLGLNEGEIPGRLRGVWKEGSMGKISEEEVKKRTSEILGLDEVQIGEFMHDLWDEYLGTLNSELTAYFAGLRPRYQTALLSNSF